MSPAEVSSTPSGFSHCSPNSRIPALSSSAVASAARTSPRCPGQCSHDCCSTARRLWPRCWTTTVPGLRVPAFVLVLVLGGHVVAWSRGEPYPDLLGSCLVWKRPRLLLAGSCFCPVARRSPPPWLPPRPRCWSRRLSVCV